MKYPLFCFIAAALAVPAARAQSQQLPILRSNLINSSDPVNGSALPSKGASDTPLPGTAAGLPDHAQSDEKKAKGPTEITSGEAAFDQKAHIAIFLINVVVKDPEFNVL